MQVSDYLSAIAFGAVIGVLGRLVLPGRQRIGIFITLLIGIAAGLLGLFIARGLGVAHDHPAHLWRLHWDWVVLGIQVALAVVGVGLANALTYTKLAGREDRPRRRSPRRSRSRSRARD